MQYRPLPSQTTRASVLKTLSWAEMSGTQKPHLWARLLSCSLPWDQRLGNLLHKMPGVQQSISRIGIVPCLI